MQVENNPVVFLMIDTQIVEEEFLEDINNMLNSGEVPNLFEGDDYEKVILDTREACNAAMAGVSLFFGITQILLLIHFPSTGLQSR